MASQLTKHKFIFAIMIVIVIVTFYFIPLNLSHRVTDVDNSIQALYQDNEQVQLRTDLNIMNFQDISNKIMRLSGEEKKQAESSLQIALQKYRNTQKVKELIENADQVLKDPSSDVIFKKHVTEDVWKEWMPFNPLTHKDPYNQKLSEVENKILMEWQNIETVSINVKRLLDSVGKSNEEMYQSILKLKELDENLAKIKHQPQYQTYRPIFDEFSYKYLGQMVENQKNGIKPTFDLKEMVLNNDVMREKIYKDNLDLRPKVALTFDDGPNEVYTPQILDILDKHNIKATFFMIGHNVSIVPHMAKEVRDRGHTIGNHTYNHPSLASLEDDEVLNEIQMTQDVIQSAVGFKPKFYRMPYGDGGKRVVDLIDDMVSIMWNADSNDWYLKTPEEIYAFLEPSFSRDDIVILMHDIHPQTIEVLDDVITTLSKKHYKFVKPDELDFHERYRPS